MISLKCYDGLIRNHKELADELGISIEGLTRREREERLILAAYEKWGVDMGAHLNGQFGIAIYDDASEELFCTRDPLGAELFFYYETADGRLLYGNEIKALFDQDGFVRELNRDLVQFYLAFNYMPGEETLFKGVWKLEPGGYLTFGKKGLKLGRFWELSFEPDESKTLEDWADEIEATFEKSLEALMDEGEVPDSFLSSGVDSSYILAKSGAKRAFCVSYKDSKASEEADARKTAEHFGREFEGVYVTPEDFFATVDEFLLAYEQPSADVSGLSLYTACKTIAQESTLCLSGEGADEFFAGYSIYGKTGRLRFNPDPVYYGATYIMSPKEQKRFLKKYCSKRSTKRFAKERGAGGRDYDILNWMLYTELRTYFEGSILLNSTKIARGTGLDIRMPYCDLRMFDIALRMPSRFKADKKHNKIAFRAAASRVLPKKVAYRKKLGFPVPARSWVADPAYNADIVRAFSSETAAEFFDLEEIGMLLEAARGGKPAKHRVWFERHKGSVWRYVWVIYTFIRWYELFFVEER